jgi:hypothetical protein
MLGNPTLNDLCGILSFSPFDLFINSVDLTFPNWEIGGPMGLQYAHSHDLFLPSCRIYADRN